jgi:hypothetical protein
MFQVVFDTSTTLPPRVYATLLFIISRIEWYCRLSELLPHEHCPAESVEEEQRGLEHALVDLYRTALLYEVRIACYQGSGSEEFSSSNAESLKLDLLEKERALASSIAERQTELRLRRLMDSVNVAAASGSNGHAEDETTETSDSGGNPVKSADNSDANSATVDRASPLPQLLGINDTFGGHVNDWLNTMPQYSKFQDWTSGESNRLLWISGAPGAGKTTVLKMIARQLREQESQRVEGKKIYPVFCDCGKPNFVSLASAIRSLVGLVHHEQPDVRKYLDDYEELTQKNLKDFNSPSNFPAMSAVLYAMTLDENFLPAYFVVDSIDEFSDNDDEGSKARTLDHVLDLISEITGGSSKVRWLLSINSAVAKGKVKDSQLHIDLDSNSSALQPAAKEHIASSVQNFTRDAFRGGEFLSSVEKELLAKSAGNFLWVNLAYKVIESHGTPWNTLHILDDLPKGIQALYRHAMNEVSHLPWADRDYCEQVLRIIAMAYRPLSLAELKDLTQLPFEVDPSVFIAKRCFTFLEVRDAVHFVHRSAKDFLETDIENRAATSRVHAEITRGCLDFLLESFQAGSSPELVSSHYATIHWMKHLSKIEHFEKEDGTIIKVLEFLEKHSLRWLESLASIRHPTQAVAQVLSLQITLEVCVVICFFALLFFFSFILP